MAGVKRKLEVAVTDAFTQVMGGVGPKWVIMMNQTMGGYGCNASSPENATLPRHIAVLNLYIFQ